jgi:hypothetical protein
MAAGGMKKERASRVVALPCEALTFAFCSIVF